MCVTTVLLASDADWLIEEVSSALSDPGTDVKVVRAGVDVRKAVATEPPQLIILDLQIGNMGGMATCMDLRLEMEAERISTVPILILLDREADVYLARQAGAQGWIVKPLDSFRLKMVSVKLLAGEDMKSELSSREDSGEVAADEHTAELDSADEDNNELDSTNTDIEVDQSAAEAG